VAGVDNKKDVKNEGRTDYVYENKEDDDKMSSGTGGFLREDAPILGELAIVSWLVGKTYTVRITNRGWGGAWTSGLIAGPVLRSLMTGNVARAFHR
jgi:hypothetical protein